ncbi:MAG: SLC13 family permease [Desulfuromonadaceae bacterium]|nr:SLC13 family permease [Desulfuromonadaceae bacterium]
MFLQGSVLLVINDDQIILLSILAATLVLFVWNRWRYDLVAMGALLTTAVAGLVPLDEVFAGFGHPAVITVACVLVLSRGLLLTGAVDALAHRVLPTKAGTTVTIAVITGLGTLLSAFMNNVGALALLMPIAIQVAAKQQLTPGKVLMPLAFGSILGGMTTMIGTPPNLIVADFRIATGSGSFAMFDYAPVGLGVAGLGFFFVVLIGWRLVPRREQANADNFDTGTYLTEVRVVENGKVCGKTLKEIDGLMEEADAQIVGMVRDQFRVLAPNPDRIIQGGDVLVVEAEPESLAEILSSLGLELGEDRNGRVGEKNGLEKEQTRKKLHGEKELEGEKDESGDDLKEVVLQEFVVMPNSILIGHTAIDIRLRARYGINLLAVSRQGRHMIKRLRSTQIQTGEVLLMQGTPAVLAEFAADFSCVPLAKRSIHIPNKRKTLIAILFMAAAIGVTAFGVLPAAISFAVASLVFILTRIVPPRLVYESIDWPVIILLGALIPVAGAMASTGAADFIARLLLDKLAKGYPIVALVVILVVTMTLSDFMNNAATAAVMCPVAISTAGQLSVNADSFLMAVAVGASCAFLTPLGHQNNTLIMGPGGFRFGDYWRLGLPLEILVVGTSVPLILWFWPL